MVVKKGNLRDEVYVQFTLKYTVATKVLKPGIGVTKNFIQNGKVNKGGDENSNYIYIPEFVLQQYYQGRFP